MQESKKMFAKWEGTRWLGERNFNFKLQENITNLTEEKIPPKVPDSVLLKDQQSY